MAKNSRKSLKDTRSIKVLRIGKKVRIRVPSFLSPQFFILVATISLIALLFPYTETVQSFDLPKLGEAAKETIISPFTFDISRSQEELEKARKNAIEQVLAVLDFDENVRKKVNSKFLDVRTCSQQTC